jgi:hypothetical protein
MILIEECYEMMIFIGFSYLEDVILGIEIDDLMMMLGYVFKMAFED